MTVMAQFKLQTLWIRNGYARWKGLLVWFGIAVIAAFFLHVPLSAAWESQYAVTGRAPFNQPDFYPIAQSLPADLYRPTGNWVGRLILPTVQQQQGETADWVWMQVYHAPAEAKALIGQQVRVEWSQQPDVQRYVKAVTRDVKFSPKVEESRRSTGNLHPDRLNGRSQVGPLQSIAGARPKDDVIVTLKRAIVTLQARGTATLQIETEPVLETGRFYTLVKLLQPVTTAKNPFIPKVCPGRQPCASELFRVQHYNPATGQFDGVQETVRIPQQPRDGFGVFASTPRDLQKSPAGEAGWYLYGAQDKTGLFTVQAIKPRSLFQLQPQRVLLNEAAGLDYLNYENWKETEQLKGRLQTVLVDATASQPEVAIANWQLGDRALVMHLFGGRGGKHGEAPVLGTVTGHFSYGLAEVVRDPFTNELQFDVRYQQVYATNIEGVIAGTNTWTNYMGNLQRGWLGTRPVNDVIVQLDEIGQDYDFGGNPLSPFEELMRQLSIINARYRVGDGTGGADVTPATSCVQDSNQALFLTVQRIRERVESSPAMQSWWTDHPEHPTVQRFERLIALGNDLEQQLAPFGIVRADWKSNANALSGTEIQPRDFIHAKDDTPENLLSAFTSWRTILPRQSQDELSILFLRHGAKLWFLRTNQVGGYDPDIFPIAPTQAFGRWTLPGTQASIGAVLFTRLLGSLKVPSLWDWGVTAGALLIYAAIALPIGLSTGFLRIKPWKTTKLHYLLLALRLFFLPALVEELVARVLLLPYPRAGVTWQMWTLWAIVSLIGFIAYHPLNAKTLYKPGYPTFFDPVFLTLTGLLGAICTVTYLLTGALLTITVLHWVVVVVWLIGLGGMLKLHPDAAGAEADSAKFAAPN